MQRAALTTGGSFVTCTIWTIDHRIVLSTLSTIKGAMRSDTVKKGYEKAPHRALLRATGLKEEDFNKPFVAIVNSYVDIVPGHVHLQDFGKLVKDAVRAAGGVPFEFNTIGVDDGIAMGHMGMKYSLPSRELIADCVETMIEAHRFDAMVCIPNCDKIVPGMLLAAMRVNIPTIFVSGGRDGSGHDSRRGNDRFDLGVRRRGGIFSRKDRRKTFDNIGKICLSRPAAPVPGCSPPTR